jgi:hypothetical protein
VKQSEREWLVPYTWKPSLGVLSSVQLYVPPKALVYIYVPPTYLPTYLQYTYLQCTYLQCTYLQCTYLH